MKLLLIALVLTGSAMASAKKSFKSPFARYIDYVENHQPEIRLQEFANACGVSIQANPIYGVRADDDGWTNTGNLVQGVKALNADLSYSTAAVWPIATRVRIIDYWFIGFESNVSTNELYCFAPSGRLRSVEILSVSPSWVMYEQNEKFDANGSVIEKTGYFVDASGTRIKEMKQDDIDIKSLDWAPDMSTAADIEKALLHK